MDRILKTLLDKNASGPPTRERRFEAPAPGRPYLARPVAADCQLAVIVYHYVGEQERSRFPRLKALALDEFVHQVRTLAERYEMATLESALAFLQGRYQPSRSLCLLTFGDGLKGHYRHVLPVLASAELQGVFFPTTSCLGGSVAAVHKNHCLMATLDFDVYRREFMTRLRTAAPDAPIAVDEARARSAYPWDLPDVAAFKYLLNYGLPIDVRTRVLDGMFADVVGDEGDVASHFYMDWRELREMQTAGMVIGGHTHRHPPLPSLDPASLGEELSTCASLLRKGLHDQALWPFSYPYGSWDARTIDAVRASEFDCSFALDGGANTVDQDSFRIRRVDAKDLVF